MRGLVDRHDTVKNQDNGAEETQAPVDSVTPPLPDQISAADLEQYGKDKQGDRLRDQHKSLLRTRKAAHHLPWQTK